MQRPGQTICNALAVMLLLFSLHAMAADTPTTGRDFNHDATGFPLNGGHATAACENCHIGGVFKGTPKICEECHALGKRVVATPKPTTTSYRRTVRYLPLQHIYFPGRKVQPWRSNTGAMLKLPQPQDSDGPPEYPQFRIKADRFMR